MPRAPRQCPAADCDELITGSDRYCPDHTRAWAGPRTASAHASNNRAWKQLRPKILARDGYECQIRYRGICTGRATTVDKIIPAARRPDLALDANNLRAACRPCNEHKGRTTDRTPTARR
jgi:5-methylcytosine-specific restriction endonuclease McrA